MKITDFEREAITQALLKSKAMRCLMLQIERVEVSDRTFSGVGFFSDLLVSDSKHELICPIKRKRFSCQFDLPELQHGGGAIVLVKDGYLSELEVYTYSENFPRDIENLKFIPVQQ